MEQKRNNRYQDQRKRPDQKGKRSFGTFEDATQKARREAKQKKNDNKTKCACGGHLKPRGAVGHAGHLRSKCRKCGRTVWTRPDFKPPIPLVPISKLNLLGNVRRVREHM